MAAEVQRRRARRAVRCLALVALVLAAFGGGTAAGQERTVEAHLFWLRTCPHCAVAREFLSDLADDVPELVVHEHEVSTDGAAQQLFVDMTEALGGTAEAVPTIIVGDRMWVGFDRSTEDEIRDEVTSRARGTGGGDAEDVVEDGTESVDVPFVGTVDVGSSSLLTSTVVIAFVDGVNPCSLWVLSVLLALVLHSGSRRRVALVGSVFLAVTTALYGLYVVGAYSLLSYASYLPWIQRAVAAVIAAFAVVNLRDYFRVGQRSALSIPEAAKSGIYQRARSLIAPQRSPLAVVAGTTVLAAGVSLAETPCSAALPLLWTNLLTTHDASTAAAVTLFGVYMVIFLVDELILFGAVVVTMRAARLQERHGRLLRLVTGSVMLTLAAAMLADPGWLDDVAGTLTVLLASVVVAAALAMFGHRRVPSATA